MQPLDNTQVILCDIKKRTFRKIHFKIMSVFNKFFVKIG